MGENVMINTPPMGKIHKEGSIEEEGVYIYKEIYNE